MMKTTQSDRDRIDPLVVLPEAPGPGLEAVTHPESQDHGQDERDVEPDDRDPGAHEVADEVVPDRPGS